MAKRGADRQITQDNWDEEEDAEEAGVFREASKDELQKRQFRRAKRRLAPGEASDKVAPVFQGFAGFAPVKANPVATASDAQTLQSSSSVVPAAVATTDGSTGPAEVNQTKPTGVAAASSAASSRDPQFAVELKSLNEAVLDWIGVHVKKNAYCILTPVFEDYDSHLKKLQTKYPTSAVAAATTKNGSAEAVSANGAASVPSDGAPAAAAKQPTAAAADSSSTPPKSSTFTFQAAATAPATFAGFSKPPTQAAAAGPTTAGAGPAPTFAFSFSSSKPFTAFGGGMNVPTAGAASAALVPSSDGARDAKSKDEEHTTTTTTTTTSAASASASASLVSGATSTAAGLFKLGAHGLASTQSSSLPTSSLFQFGSQAATGAPGGFGVTGSLFQFGTKAALSTSDGAGSAADVPKPGTSFLFQNIGSKPGVSSSAGDGAAAGGDDAEDNEEYVPPKPEVVNTVTEEGSVYSKRVKLFYKKDDSYVDKGIGNLFIKKVDTKAQLVLRADTNLGNILLNIVLNDKIPVVRQGTNNVSLVCIANPPMDPKLDATKPVALLLRVKAAPDADELAAELNKHKKQV